MGIALKVGEKIPLFLLTENRVTDRVVRARIRNALGAEITGSPFTVPHLADGEYFDDSVLMPNTPSIIISYDVFDGPGFTNPSQDLLPEDERFDLDELGSAIDDLKNAARGQDLEAIISTDDNLEAVINEGDENLEAILSDNELEAVIIESSDELEAIIESDNLEGEISC